MHIKSIKFNFIESIHLRKIITSVAFFRSIYVVICFMMSVSIYDIKIKTLFNNDVKINCILKRLINTTQLFIY